MLLLLIPTCDDSHNLAFLSHKQRQTYTHVYACFLRHLQGHTLPVLLLDVRVSAGISGNHSQRRGIVLLQDLLRFLSHSGVAEHVAHSYHSAAYKSAGN